MNGLTLSTLLLVAALAFVSMSEAFRGYPGVHGAEKEKGGAKGGYPGGEHGDDSSEEDGHHGKHGGGDKCGPRCRDSVWFQPTSAIDGASCLEELSTATNHTTSYCEDQTLLKVGQNFTVCLCCERGESASCTLVTGTAQLQAVNVTFTQ